MSRDYILLSTFEQKTAFLVIYKCVVVYFWAAWKAYLTSMNLSTTTPGPGTPSPIVGAPTVLEPPSRSLALSQCRSGASYYGRSMT